ncbi:MAG: hypothetical protein R2784_02460 [Saprospiraceae bacterium]
MNPTSNKASSTDFIDDGTLQHSTSIVFNKADLYEDGDLALFTNTLIVYTTQSDTKPGWYPLLQDKEWTN